MPFRTYSYLATEVIKVRFRETYFSVKLLSQSTEVDLVRSAEQH